MHTQQPHLPQTTPDPYKSTKNKTDNPQSLRIVAGLFILSGIITAIEIAFSLAHGHLNLNLGILSLWIGPGLLRHDRDWRNWAIIFLWIGMICIPAILIFGCIHGNPQIELFGTPASKSWNIPIFIYLAASFILDIWQYRVLTRPEIKALFNSA